MIGLLDMKANETVRRVYDPEGLALTLTTSEGGHRQPKILEQFRVRKLTPREYARLQGFPDTYEQIVSNSQFYKQMGNAVTVNVSHAIAKAIGEQL
jgi:DNA (cytosine-5)-methyltransferase 1